MTGTDLKRLRRELGLSCIEMGRALGYTGNDNSSSTTIRAYERGKKPIPPDIILKCQRLASLEAIPPATIGGILVRAYLKRQAKA